ncbi:MAG: citramalate synthase, partial [Solirubrobacterales bacterium]
MEKVKLYDTTLRDGMQGPGMTLSAEEKVRVVHALDGLGIDFIEAGFPSSNPKEQQLFDLLAEEKLEHSEVVAFGMTRRRGIEPGTDDALKILATSFSPWVALVGKTWRLHLEKVTKVDPDENLAMIRDSIAWMVDKGKELHYDAEHFFDAWRDDRAYALACLEAAIEGGASIISL